MTTTMTRKLGIDTFIGLAVFFISYRCDSEPSEVSTNWVPDSSDLFAMLHVNASCSRGSVEVVVEIADVYFHKKMHRMSSQN